MSLIFVLRAKSPCSGVCLLVLNLHRLDAWLLAVGLAAVQTPPGQPWPCPQGQGGKNGKVSIHCVGFKGLVTTSVYFPSKPPPSVEPNFSWWFSLCGAQRHSWYVPRISAWGSCFSLLACRRSSSSLSSRRPLLLIIAHTWRDKLIIIHTWQCAHDMSSSSSLHHHALVKT